MARLAMFFGFGPTFVRTGNNLLTFKSIVMFHSIPPGAWRPRVEG